MNFVEPIRDRKKIAQIKNLLRGETRFRDLLLFTVRINAALRISDLLQLRVNHFFDAQKRPRRRFRIREEKRGKRQEVVVNDSMREVLAEYLDAYPDVIVDQQPGEGQAWRFITTICQSVGMRGNFGTHSLRKTWGYHARTNGVDLALIMHKHNHSSLAYTKRYLGITDDELQAVIQRLNL
jgi:integrase